MAHPNCQLGSVRCFLSTVAHVTENTAAVEVRTGGAAGRPALPGSASDSAAAEVAPLLIELPPATLTEAQACGRSCVWCGSPLDPGKSINLGERDCNGRRIFPRGCARCVQSAAYKQVLDHSSSCEQCADNAALCPDTAALRKALQEARR